MKKRVLIQLLGVSLCILCIPLISMMMTDQVAWGPGDFIIAFVFLFGLGSSIVFFRKKYPRKTWIIFLIILLFLLLWAELAVGVFGSTVAGN